MFLFVHSALFILNNKAHIIKHSTSGKQSISRKHFNYSPSIQLNDKSTLETYPHPPNPCSPQTRYEGMKADNQQRRLKKKKAKQ